MSKTFNNIRQGMNALESHVRGKKVAVGEAGGWFHIWDEDGPNPIPVPEDTKTLLTMLGWRVMLDGYWGVPVTQ